MSNFYSASLNMKLLLGIKRRGWNGWDLAGRKFIMDVRETFPLHTPPHPPKHTPTHPHTPTTQLVLWTAWMGVHALQSRVKEREIIVNPIQCILFTKRFFPFSSAFSPLSSLCAEFRQASIGRGSPEFFPIHGRSFKAALQCLHRHQNEPL